MSEVATPLRALLVGLAGVFLAWLWFNDQLFLAVALAVVVSLVGVVLDAAGRAALPQWPEVAVRFLEWWILTPAALAAFASAVVVVVTVALTIGEGVQVDPDVKELVGTLSTGLVAFVTAAFISWSGDDKDSKVADHIRDTFRQKYKRAGNETQRGVHYFPAESAGERWVYSNEYRGIEGWGHAARVKRAQGIAAELKR